MNSKYHHLTAADRYTIDSMRKSKYSQRQIAEVLGVHAATICRELRRNVGSYGYRALLAENKATVRRKICRKPIKITETVSERLTSLLRQQWSPEQIAGRLSKTNELHVSKETIYEFIRKDRQAGGKLYRHLRHPGKYRKRGSGKKVCIIDRISIDQRPPEVSERSRIGDWEIDTVYCSTGPEVLVTLVERKSKFTLIRKLPGRHAHRLARTVRDMLCRHKQKSLTITADNGTEFAAHKLIARLTGTQVYFAHPYCSFERGLNENTNGLIRQYIPRSRKGETVSTWEIRDIQDKLNDRPRKTLDFLTPREIFFNDTSVALQG